MGSRCRSSSGLKQGEVVVTQGAYGLPDKTKVKIEKPEADDKDDKEAKGDDAKDDSGERRQR